MRALQGWVKRYFANGEAARQLAEGGRLLRALDGNGPSEQAAEQTIRACLQSPAWEARNLAVKLIARLGNSSFFDDLIRVLADRSECGIVRRSAATALREVGHWTSEAQRAVAAGLHDSYWEVRTEALHTLAALGTPSEKTEALILAVLFGGQPGAHRAEAAAPHRRGRLRERNFEVRAACAEALGALAVSERAFAALCGLCEDRSWIVQYQATVALGEVAARNERLRGAASEQIRRVRITPECSVPQHPFRDRLERLAVEVLDDHLAEHPERVRPLYLDLKRGWNVVGADAVRAEPGRRD